MNNVIKYTYPHLMGYGFDLDADRVVNFTKHKDGTYVKTRTMYHLHGYSLSHQHLRSLALDEIINETQGELKYKASWFTYGMIAAIILTLLSLTQCTVETNISIDQVQEEK